MDGCFTLAVNLPVSAKHQLQLLVNHQVLIPTSAFVATFCWVAGLEIFSNSELVVCCLERYFKDFPRRLKQYEDWVRNGVLKFYSNSICNTFFTSNYSLLVCALNIWTVALKGVDVNGVVRNMSRPRNGRYENPDHQEPILKYIILVNRASPFSPRKIK